MHHDHKLKANENRCGLVGNIKVCISARFFSLDQGLSSNLSLSAISGEMNLFDLEHDLIYSFPVEKFVPKHVL